MVIKMKRSLFHAFVLLLISAILLLTGCSVLDEIFNKTTSGESKVPSTLAKERQTEIMECFINKDGETLKSFFSEYVLENVPDLDTQIETALNFLDGEIVSYDEPFPVAMGSSERKFYGGVTENIITDKDTEYQILFHGWLTNDEKPKEVGVYCITVIIMTEAEKLPDDTTISAGNTDRVYIGEPQ